MQKRGSNGYLNLGSPNGGAGCYLPAHMRSADDCIGQCPSSGAKRKTVLIVSSSDLIPSGQGHLSLLSLDHRTVFSYPDQVANRAVAKIGLAKKNAVNVPRVKEGIHNAIVYCKANRDKRIIQAIDVIQKQEQKR